MASSSSVRSSASAALLGDSRDSWEWDSLKLCIKRVLKEEGAIAVRCGGVLFMKRYSAKGLKLMEETLVVSSTRDGFDMNLQQTHRPLRSPLLENTITHNDKRTANPFSSPRDWKGIR